MLDQGHRMELLLPWQPFTDTMGTATIANALLSLLSALLPFSMIRSGKYCITFGEFRAECQSLRIRGLLAFHLLLVFVC